MAHGWSAASERPFPVSITHHGEVRGCQRACERTPLRGRRRATNNHYYPMLLTKFFPNVQAKLAPCRSLQLLLAVSLGFRF
jgi:hypothetical protein